MLERWVVLVLMVGCTKSTHQLPDASPTPIAIAPLAGEPEWIGVALANNVSQRLFLRDDLASYTGRQIAAAMHQARAVPADLINPSKARDVGRHLGARFLVSGEATLREGNIVGKVRLIEVKTGDILTSRELSGPAGDLRSHAERVAELLARVTGGTLKARGTPVSLDALGNATRAAIILRQQSLSPRAADPLASMGLSAAKLREAKQLAGQAKAAAPRWGEAFTLLGLAEAMDGNTQEARRLLDKATTLEPGDAPLTILARVFVQVREGRLDRAEASLRQAIKAHPGFLHGRGSLAELLLHYGRLREAQAAFRQYLEVVPDHPWVVAKLGYVAAKLGKYDEAVARSRAALALLPSSTYLLTELASRQIDANDLEGARLNLNKVIQRAPDDARAHVRLAYVELLRGADAEAIRLSTRALDLGLGARHRWERAYAHLNLARAHGRAGNLDLALDHLRRARSEADVSFDELELDPKLSELVKDPRYAGLLD
jgi:tetratricopeptide (TPR) repeat protein